MSSQKSNFAVIFKMKRNRFLLIILFFVQYMFVFAQGQLSGDLMLNSNFYQRDSTINAYNTPAYDNLLSSTDAWLNLNYSYLGFNAGLRLDLFNNSILHNSKQAYSEQGIGTWYISKQIDKLNVTGGYFYDQFGNGITFRSYEDRALGVDYAIFGIKLDYKLTDNWKIKAFTGKQKNLFSTFRPIIKGINTEWNIKINDNLQLNPGAALVNRTIDQTSMNIIVNRINSMPLEERFVPQYNVLVYSMYNSLLYKNVAWSFEVAQKTKEAVVDLNGKLASKDGNVLYTNLSYSTTGFGITGQFKRTENFSFRTSPNEILLQGIIDFLPPLTRLSSLRLLSRYIAATQVLSEMAYEGDIYFSPHKGLTFSLNYSDIKNLNNVQLYREIYGDVEIKKSKTWKAESGVQYINYNYEIYRNEPGPDVEAISPFVEFTYKLNPKNSLRTELQYQYTEQDYGQWAFALLEYSIAPHFSFSVSDMYNIVPKKTNDIHYYSFFTSYTQNSTRFTLSYVKQIEGIICTGGVCRYEPAFSGVKFTLTTNF